MPKRFVICDLDGVLWDSRENMRRSWAAVVAATGVDVPFKDYFRNIGRPFPEIMMQLGLADRAAEIETVFRLASMEHMASAQFYPGTAEMLSQLKKVAKLGIVTSKDELRTNAILALLPVTFDVVRTPASGGRGKPAPDHLLAAIVAAGVDPAESVYVGDMASDCEAAARAHVDYAHAAWGYGEVPPNCWMVLRQLSEFSRLIAGERS
jgi:HAD superfamily hydrolase (TIGR01509 family)